MDDRNASRDPNYTPLLWFSGFFCVCCCCICLIFIFAWFLFLFKMLSVLEDYRNDVKQALKHTPSIEYLHPKDRNMFNYYENIRECSADHRFLPYPKSQDEEDEMITAINSSVDSDCEFVFFGFKADEYVRYQLLSSHVTWPTLKTLRSGAAWPFNLDDCYEIKFFHNGSLSVESVLNCGEKMAKHLLFLTKDGKKCSRDSFTCLKIYNALPNSDVKTSFKTAKLENPNLLTLVPFDKDHPPESLQLKKLKFTDPLIVIAVKYKFVYKQGSDKKRYTSSRFSVTNPEFDCIAYDIKRDTMVTRKCEDKGCPVCIKCKTNLF